MLIDADDVSLVIGDTKILDEVSFCIHSGEFIGLIGPNGAGKTTLLKAVLGLQPISNGTIERAKSTIGYIPQRGSMYDSQVAISVMEVVQLGSRGDKKVALAALKEVKMADSAGQRISELSGGQQQRVLIAKALASKSDILILDEPTTGIDERSQDEFYAILKKLRSRGIAVVMVSHDVDTVLTLVSRVICLNRTILYDGPPEHFEADRYLPRLYGRQHRLLHHDHKSEGDN